jgi:hypothetical protein
MSPSSATDLSGLLAKTNTGKDILDVGINKVGIYKVAPNDRLRMMKMIDVKLPCIPRRNFFRLTSEM